MIDIVCHYYLLESFQEGPCRAAPPAAAAGDEMNEIDE